VSPGVDFVGEQIPELRNGSPVQQRHQADEGLVGMNVGPDPTPVEAALGLVIDQLSPIPRRLMRFEPVSRVDQHELTGASPPEERPHSGEPSSRIGLRCREKVLDVVLAHQLPAVNAWTTLYQEVREVAYSAEADDDRALRQRLCAHTQRSLPVPELYLAESRHRVAKWDRNSFDHSFEARTRTTLCVVKRQGKTSLHEETLERQSERTDMPPWLCGALQEVGGRARTGRQQAPELVQELHRPLRAEARRGVVDELLEPFRRRLEPGDKAFSVLERPVGVVGPATRAHPLVRDSPRLTADHAGRTDGSEVREASAA
jgi:hypothetical protein